MPGRFKLVALIALTAILSAAHARAQSDNDRYTIMAPEKGSKPGQPEPWLPPKYQSPRGTRQHIAVPPPATVPHPRPPVPPSIHVPETGRTLPNLPAVSGSGPGGAETSQDRAARCSHQAGVYGQAAGDRNAYIGSCVNQ